ncbi:unnamed protein product [Ambrosiozyma monospora]|uniref:Cystathionine beta-lyase n=1 Tax=Ambrosiozyma monospora TaxID=43982 RepID=A0A9W7DHU0_AMBMO|nr:unnamed protein product [Ambrosiozyma monospora]
MTNANNWKLNTKVVKIEHEDGNHASIPPIYQSTTFKAKNMDEMGQYDYTRSGNPTRTTLQEHLAKIIGCETVWAVNSGMSALDIIARLIKPGEHVVAGDDLYGGTQRLLTFLNTNGGANVSHIDLTNLDLVKKTITKDTAVVFLESPTNPLIKVVDLKSIADYAHSMNPNALVVFDNTMMTPLLMKPLELGADIQYESATKYLNGHHDIMAGIIATNSEDLAKRLFFVINSIGSGLAPFDSWLLLRGLKTLSLRLERQQSNALKLATWLQGQGLKVRYPGLKDHPQYELHHSQCKGDGAVLSFETGDLKTSEKIIAEVELYAITVSFGAVNSLISLPCKMSHAAIDPKVRAERDFPEDLIRICVGIEDVDDLIDDLNNALKKAGVVKN